MKKGTEREAEGERQREGERERQTETDKQRDSALTSPEGVLIVVSSQAPSLDPAGHSFN